MEIVRAVHADVSLIMRTERLEGREAMVGRWDETQHRAAMDDPACAYFVGRDDGRPVGFVILRGWASPERVTLLKRIAVGAPGRGHGRTLLAGVVDKVFGETDAFRLWLGVFPDNLRARRAYEAVGFASEGVARGAAFFEGIHRDELIMSMLRPDWESARGLAQGAI